MSYNYSGDDFTFSKQVKGMKIPYGTSGDCYSSSSACPQGRFSVDLTHTSFKLANYVHWRKTGRYSSTPRIFRKVLIFTVLLKKELLDRIYFRTR